MKTILTIIIFLSFNISFAADEEKVPKAKKLEFTSEEFKTAVAKELEKTLKKIGRGKMINFSKELLKKEEALTQKEQEISKREDKIKNSKKNFKKQILEFQERQNKFLSCRDDIDKKENSRITHMVDVISGMRPQNASDILSVQDPIISVKILSKLDSVKVSKIFNVMDKEISARLQKQYMTMKE
jgi:flagellar motility protein MotE (MotC chaperone)